jgi:hypothetical protein
MQRSGILCLPGRTVRARDRWLPWPSMHPVNQSPSLRRSASWSIPLGFLQLPLPRDRHGLRSAYKIHRASSQTLSSASQPRAHSGLFFAVDGKRFSRSGGPEIHGLLNDTPLGRPPSLPARAQELLSQFQDSDHSPQHKTKHREKRQGSMAHIYNVRHDHSKCSVKFKLLLLLLLVQFARWPKTDRNLLTARGIACTATLP